MTNTSRRQWPGWVLMVGVLIIVAFGTVLVVTS